MKSVVEDKWNDILDYVKKEYGVTDVSYRTWLQPLKVHSVTDKCITVAVDDSKVGPESVNFIKKKYGFFLKVAVAEILNKEYEIEFALQSKLVSEDTSNSSVTSIKNESLSYLNPRYTFDTFVV